MSKLTAEGVPALSFESNYRGAQKERDSSGADPNAKRIKSILSGVIDKVYVLQTLPVSGDGKKLEALFGIDLLSVLTVSCQLLSWTDV